MSTLLDPLQAAINEARKGGDRMLVVRIRGAYRVVDALKHRAQDPRQLEVAFDEMLPQTRALVDDLYPPKPPPKPKRVPTPKPPKRVPKPKPPKFVLAVTHARRTSTPKEKP